MIRIFCDCCGSEISERDYKDRNPLRRLQAMLRGVKAELTVEVLESKDGTSNAGHFCRYCVLDALEQLDDRPRMKDRIDLYSELAEAFGCDPMDPHEARLNRAKRARKMLETKPLTIEQSQAVVRNAFVVRPEICGDDMVLIRAVEKEHGIGVEP